MRTKQDLIDIIESWPITRNSRIVNPRMRQLHKVLCEQLVYPDHLPFFEQEIIAFKLKADKRERRRIDFIRKAAVYLSQ